MHWLIICSSLLSVQLLPRLGTCSLNTATGGWNYYCLYQSGYCDSGQKCTVNSPLLRAFHFKEVYASKGHGQFNFVHLILMHSSLFKMIHNNACLMHNVM